MQLLSAIQWKGGLEKTLLCSPIHPSNLPLGNSCSFPNVRMTVKGKYFESVQDIKTARTLQLRVPERGLV